LACRAAPATGPGGSWREFPVCGLVFPVCGENSLPGLSGDYRFSEDLDFTLAGEIPLESILAGLEEVYAQVQNASGIPFRSSSSGLPRNPSHFITTVYGRK